MWPFKNRTEKSEATTRRSVVSIRLEAIGGQGANTAGKVLAEAAVLGMGYRGNHFSSFGSEKRGSPVRSYVRFSTDETPVRTASAIRVPDLLLIFHASLLATHPEILEGVGPETDVVINGSDPRRSPIHWPLPDGQRARSVQWVDAVAIARTEGCGVNVAMLGAAAALLPELEAPVLERTLRTYFLHRHPSSTEGNAKGFSIGLDQLRVLEQRYLIQAPTESTVSLPEMGWSNAPFGGVITNPGNSILKDHSSSRNGVAPSLRKDLCFHCGLCDMVCPDFCFVWELDTAGAPKLSGIDYQYCKGCQKCVTVCPVDALVPVPESRLTAEEKSVHLFDLRTLAKAPESGIVSGVTFVERLQQNWDRSPDKQAALLDHESYLKKGKKV